MSFGISIANYTGMTLNILNLRTNINNVGNKTLYPSNITGNNLLQNSNSLTSYPTSVSSGNMSIESDGGSFYVDTETINSISWDGISSNLGDSYMYTSPIIANFDIPSTYANKGLDIGENISSTIMNGMNLLVITFGISLNGTYYYTTYPGDPNIMCLDFNQSTKLYEPTVLEKSQTYQGDPANYKHILVGIPIEIIAGGVTNSSITYNWLYKMMSGEVRITSRATNNGIYSSDYVPPTLTVDTDNQVTSDTLNSIVVKQSS